MNKKYNLIFMIVFGCALLLSLSSLIAQDNETEKKENNTAEATAKKKNILFVVTSHGKLGETGKETGYYLSEVTHPWQVLTKAGYTIDFVSPRGGKPPVEGFDLADPVNKEFWDNQTYRDKIENTMKPSEVDPDKYAAIYFAGGHGTMWDFPDNKELAAITKKIYNNGGVVSAVCHGPAALVNVKLDNGKHLVDGKKINSFTNEEEKAVKKDDIVPFMLETVLIERGAKFEKSGIEEAHVVTSERVVTGQNPQSAKGVGEAILKEINAQKVEANRQK